MASTELSLATDAFDLRLNRHNGTITSLRHPSDVFATDFMAPLSRTDDAQSAAACAFGNLNVTAKWDGDLASTTMATALSHDNRRITASLSCVTANFTTDSALSGGIVGLSIQAAFSLSPSPKSVLSWTVRLTNQRPTSVEVEDLGFPLPMNSYWGNDQTQNYEQRVQKHSFVAGHGSYIYWQRPCGDGRILVMTPSPGTSLEFKQRMREGEVPFGEDLPRWEGLSEYYIHSKRVSETRAEMAKCYLPPTSLELDPGQSREYGFVLLWADSFSGLRHTIFTGGGLDVISLPGLVIPIDQEVSLALRSNSGVQSVSNDHVQGARIQQCGIMNGYTTFTLRFLTKGQHYVKVLLGDSNISVLQYFCTDPVETLIDARANFLVQKQLVRKECGYKGAFLQWDMSRKRLLTWDNWSGDGWKEWMVGGSDDLGLAPAVFLSERCLRSPRQDHVEAIDYHIEHFILGYLMSSRDADGKRTFQVYRWFDGQSETPYDTGIWRAYNYTHIANVFYNMYQISRAFPWIQTRLPAGEYLGVSFEVLNAMYCKIDLPNPIGDAANTLGLMGESMVPEIIAALSKEGMHTKASKLEDFATRKLEYYRSVQYPFASEMTIDTTGFESVYRFAKYFGTQDLALKTQKASLACRGLQPVWYFYGSDNRMQGESYWNLSYETHLGAWQQLDYLKTYSSASDDDFDDAMRSTYGAYFGGWANVNTGQIDDSLANVGAAAWLWQSEGGRCAWSWMPMIGQWWAWSGEVDLGLWGGLRTAAVSVVRDPIFGLYAYGGDVTLARGAYNVTPKDGVRSRLTIYPCNRLSVEVAHGRYTKATIAEDGSLVELRLSCDVTGGANVTIRVTQLPYGVYQGRLDDRNIVVPNLSHRGRDTDLEVSFPLIGVQKFVLQRQHVDS